jgi:hypothetical protein
VQPAHRMQIQRPLRMSRSPAATAFLHVHGGQQHNLQPPPAGSVTTLGHEAGIHDEQFRHCCNLVELVVGAVMGIQDANGWFPMPL